MLKIQYGSQIPQTTWEFELQPLTYDVAAEPTRPKGLIDQADLGYVNSQLTARAADTTWDTSTRVKLQTLVMSCLRFILNPKFHSHLTARYPISYLTHLAIKPNNSGLKYLNLDQLMLS